MKYKLSNIASKTLIEDSLDIKNEVSLSVNPVLAQNIQTKIKKH